MGECLLTLRPEFTSLCTAIQGNLPRMLADGKQGLAIDHPPLVLVEVKSTEGRVDGHVVGEMIHRKLMDRHPL